MGAEWCPRNIGTGPNEDMAPASCASSGPTPCCRRKGGGRRPTRMRATPGNEAAGLGLNDDGHPATTTRTTAGWSTETVEDLRRPRGCRRMVSTGLWWRTQGRTRHSVPPPSQIICPPHTVFVTPFRLLGICPAPTMVVQPSFDGGEGLLPRKHRHQHAICLFVL